MKAKLVTRFSNIKKKWNVDINITKYETGEYNEVDFDVYIVTLIDS